MRVELASAEAGSEGIVVSEPSRGGAARRERGFPADGAGCAAARALIAAWALRGPEAGEDDSDEELEACVSVSVRFVCVRARVLVDMCAYLCTRGVCAARS